MGLEESVDMNQYLVREMRKLKEQLDHWRGYANAQTGRITKLNSQVEGLEEVQSNHMGEIEQLEEENRELKLQVSVMDAYNKTRLTPKQVKEMTAHGISD